MAKDAGRILKLSEVFRITDEAGEFYLKYPSSLQIADDGSIFVADAEQLLKFSPEGKFLNNLFKKGQGPGEIGGNWFHFFIHGRDLFIQDLNSRRFWRADFDGVFKEPVNLENKDYDSLLGVLPNGFLFEKQIVPPPGERTGKLMEIIHIVALIARDGSFQRDVATFKPKTFLGYQSGMGWDNSITKPGADSRLLFALHSRDYLIEVVDLASGKTINRLGRVYAKISHAEEDWEPDFRKRTGAPKIEAMLDRRDDQAADWKAGRIETPELIVRWYDREDHDSFDVCADDHCQRYQGLTKIISSVAAEAVASTRGVFLVHDNRVCDARFYKACGGRTEELQNAWEDQPRTYLKSITDAPRDVPVVSEEMAARRWIESSPEASFATPATPIS